MKNLIILFISVLALTRLYAQGKEFIKPDAKCITVDGAFFVNYSGGKLVINRHKPEIIDMKETEAHPRNAFAQSGVSVSFATDSRNIKVLMVARKETSLRFGIFGIYKNGKLVDSIKVFPKNADNFTGISFSNPNGGMAEWKVLFPTYFGVFLNGLELDIGSTCKAVKKQDMPVYVAIGNSITQGTGQAASYQTYAYRLAEKKAWQLYNLAVGGSKISWPFALELKDKKVDVMTILWGFNDWKKGYTPKREITPRYMKLLKILADDHPDAKIYCITPTYTNATTPKNGRVTIDEIREAEMKAVKKLKKKGYKNLYAINGPDISGPENLNPKRSKDVVHFTVEGCETFAEKLSDIIK